MGGRRSRRERGGKGAGEGIGYVGSARWCIDRWDGDADGGEKTRAMMESSGPWPA
jgi:hypothetical protein